MKLSKAKQEILEQARDAGFTIFEGQGYVDVYKLRVYHNYNRVSMGVRLWESGATTDLTVPCDVQKTMTIKQIREALKLKA